jgi:hypothetical protein
VGPEAQLKEASSLFANGNPVQALALVNEALAGPPSKPPLMSQLVRLKARVLMALHDVEGALVAWEAYAETAAGANKSGAQGIIADLRTAQPVTITVAKGPAEVYVGQVGDLDPTSLGVFCVAAPVCAKRLMPGNYRVIVERSGFVTKADKLRVANGKPAALGVELVELPSRLTVRVAQADARITLDDKPFDPSLPLDAGSHRLRVTLAGHRDERREIEAHEGKPIELEVSLVPLVPIHVEPADAALALDGKLVTPEDGTLVIPPGGHTLVARRRGYLDASVQVPAERPTDYKLAVTLAVIPPPVIVPSRFTPRRKVAIAVGGLGVAAGVVGAVLGVRSRQADHDAFKLCPSPTEPCAAATQADDLNELGRSRALQANIAFGVASGAAVAAAILWLTGSPESSPAPASRSLAVTPRIGEVSGVDVLVRF